MAAYSSQVSGTPLSSCSPRSSNSIPEPATRSFTVRDTSTSPGPASALTARRDVDGDAADVVAHHLALARVDARADADALLLGGVEDRARAADRARRAVEGGEEAVAGRLHLAAAEALERARARSRSWRSSSSRQRWSPSSAAVLGGVDDVGEEHRREHALGLGLGARAGEELLDLAERQLGVLVPGDVVVAGQLDEPGVRQVLGQPAAVCAR